MPALSPAGPPPMMITSYSLRESAMSLPPFYSMGFALKVLHLCHPERSKGSRGGGDSFVTPFLRMTSGAKHTRCPHGKKIFRLKSRVQALLQLVLGTEADNRIHRLCAFKHHSRRDGH